MSRLLLMESPRTIVDLLGNILLYKALESIKGWMTAFFPKGKKAPQDYRSVATKCNKIGDETKHGHNNMITKYSFSFRVLTSKLTKLQIFCHIWIGPHCEFIYWKKLNKLSNNGDKLITTSLFVCPHYLQAFGEWSLPIDWLLCAVLILSVFSCLLWAIKNWIWGVQLP